MEKLSRDELYSIGMQLDLPDLLQLCATSKNINEKLCNRNHLWINRLNRDFKDLSDTLRKDLPNDPKDIYILLWSLRDLKQQLNLSEDIYALYFKKELNLNNKKLTKLPSSIRFLTNLQKLNISGNLLEKLPDYLPNSLITLIAYDNQLKELPKYLPNSLQLLYVGNNQLIELPVHLPDSLKRLDINNNQLEKLPQRLPDFLEKLYVINNQLKELPDLLPNSLQKLYVDEGNRLRSEIKRIRTLYPNLEIHYY